MARSTGPILAMGAITIGNSVIIHEKPFDWWQPLAIGITAIVFQAAEKIAPEWTVGLAWLALATVVLVRVDPRVPSPAESFTEWLGYKT